MTVPPLARIVLALAIACGPAKAFSGPPGLASRPLGLSLLREDEVRRYRQTIGTWTLVCDEVIRLGQRYCTLTSPVQSREGDAATIEVSTDDAGQPAALLGLPPGIALGRGLDVRPGGAGPKPKHLELRTCDARACLAVWPLDRAAFAALQSSGARLTFVRCRSVAWSTPALSSSSCSAADALVPSAGLREIMAIASSARSLPPDPPADLRSTFADAPR